MILANNIKDLTGFVAIKGYSNTKGEVRDIVLNVGIRYGRLKQNDIKRLKKLKLNFPDSGFTKQELRDAKDSLLAGLTKVNNRPEIYDTVGKNIKVHKVTGQEYIFGIVLPSHKKVIKKGTYPTVNSRRTTLAKSFLSKHLSINNYRMFKLDQVKQLNANKNQYK